MLENCVLHHDILKPTNDVLAIVDILMSISFLIELKPEFPISLFGVYPYLYNKKCIFDENQPELVSTNQS